MNQMEAAAMHGLATNRAVPTVDRLGCALEALEFYEAEIERLRTIVRHVEHYGIGYVWHSPDGDNKVLHPVDVTVVIPANRDSELELLRDLAVKAKAWRCMRNLDYRPGEINPHLLTAHQEDLDLAAAVDRLYPPDGES